MYYLFGKFKIKLGNMTRKKCVTNYYEHYKHLDIAY